MNGFKIDINGKVMSTVTPRGLVSVFLERERISIIGHDIMNGVEFNWGEIPLSVGDRVIITAIDSDKSDTSICTETSDEDLLRKYNRYKEILIDEGLLK